MLLSTFEKKNFQPFTKKVHHEPHALKGNTSLQVRVDERTQDSFAIQLER